MNPTWRLIVLGIIWITRSESRTDYYHELSMETFSPSTNVTGQNSLFGYSVTYVPANKRLIVSAPKMSYIGEVFACDIQNKSCEQIHHNITDVNKGHYSWLGATVKAGENFFTTCAPRFLTTVFKLKGTYSRCYQFSSAGENFELKLLAQMIKKEISYPPERLMDSFGWSIAVAGQNVTIGGPAVYKGRVIQYTNISSLSLKPKLIDAFNLDINYNFGYSVAAGYFLQKGKISFAFSSPYGEDGHGKIFIYDGKKTVPIKDAKNVPQVGSLFGVSLCSAYAGFRSALLVGAPAYGSEHQYNVGAVYIYEFNRDQRSMEYIKTVYAQKDGGYFGYAMTSLGDLNGDKFDEVAISAPYEDDGRGAVYIYSGKHLISKSKNELTWLQRIQPEQYRGFGLSLSMLEDYDENGCNELAIGAPNNETVVLLRCMASIGLRILKLNPYKETIKSTTTTGPLFKFGSCIEIYYPPKLKTIEADISMTITITHKNCKLENGTVDGTVITFNIPKDVLQWRENKFCQNVTIVTPQEASYDPLVPFKISASLNNDPRNLKVFNPSRVVINERGDSSVTENVYVRECKENKCMPKLNFKVLSSFPDSYIIGSTNTEILRIFITNNGDVAYDVCVTVLIKGVPIKEWPRSCVWNDDTNVLTCKPLILIRNNTIWKNDDILLDTQSLNSKDKAVDVNVKLYTVCGDSLTKEHNISVLLLSDRNLTVTGSTTGGDVVNVTKDNIHYTGKQIQHAYSIYNNGTTTWVNFKMIIELEKQSYIGKYTVNTGDAFDCTDFKETPNMHIITCEVKIIKANRKVEVILSIDLPPVTLGDFLNKQEGAIIVSHLKIFLHNDQKFHSIKSRLLLYNIEVPLWIIISATLVGLLLLVILALILHECGCLRRKNKEKLKELKKDVKRQSMRRSMMVRDSPRTSRPIDIQPLISSLDSEEFSGTYNQVPKPVPVEIAPTALPKVDTPKSPATAVTAPVIAASANVSLAPISSLSVTPKVTPTPPSKPSTKPNDRSEYESQNKIRADLILGGLQKNLAKQHSLGGSTLSLTKI